MTRRKTLYLVGLLAALACVSMPVWGWSPMTLFYRFVGVGVAKFTPSGQVGSDDVVIRVTFSGDVTPTAGASLNRCLSIDPPLPGSARLEDGKTLVYVPSRPLRPSTRYTVRLTGLGLKAKDGSLLQTSDDEEFNTPAFAVTKARLFYLMDSLGEKESQLMAEIDFSDPIDASALRPGLKLTKDGQPVDFQLEDSRNPCRFYLRAGRVARGDKSQTYRLEVAQGLLCRDCGLGLEQADVETLELQAKPVFSLQQIESHPLPGATLVGLDFSLPVSAAELRAHLRVEQAVPFAHAPPTVPFSVETEYTYAVLKGDFLPNAAYQVVVTPGLRAEDGQPFVGPKPRKDGTMAWPVTIQDLPSTVRFADKGDIVGLHGPLNIAVKTVNLDKFSVSISKVYRNNLVRFLRANGDADLGRVLGSQDVAVRGGRINEEVETDINLAKSDQGPYRGLYEVSLSGEGAGSRQDWDNDEDGFGRDWDAQTRTLLITDLGLLAKSTAGDVWVQVVSNSTLQPVAGVRLDLVSTTNQTMRSASSDANGRAHFSGLAAQTDEQFQPFVVEAQKGDDFSYLRLDSNPIPTSAFDVGGDSYSTAGIEAYLASDRGLYRPGETAHVTAILRRGDLGKAADLPLTLKLLRGDDEVASLTAKADRQGMVVFNWDIPKDLATGDVQASLNVGTVLSLATTTLKVEEFIPDKIRARADAGTAAAVAGTPLDLTVSAEQLFGGPAAGLRVRGEVSWQARLFEPAGWDGYHFADDAREFSVQTDALTETDTDAKGQAVFPLLVPDSLQPPSMLEAVVRADVFDSGGRPVGTSARFLAHVYPYYLGLKPAAGPRPVVGKSLGVDLAAVLPAGKGLDLKGVPIAVKRRVWYSLFQQLGSTWSGWASQSYDEDVLRAAVDLPNGRGEFRFIPDKPGDYTVVLGGEEGHRASVVVSVGAAGSDASGAPDLENPGRLDLRLDRARYLPGQVAHVRVRAPFAGRLLLSVEREGVLWQDSSVVPAGVSVRDVPVPVSALPNVYVVGLLVRKPEQRLRDLPVASFGAVPLAVDFGSRKIPAVFRLPATVRSRAGVDGRLALGRKAAGASVVVAAVDEGILQIVNFASPDPLAYFYRKRSLDVSTLCGMAELLPDLRIKGAVGGDEDEGYARRHLNPVQAQRVKPMVWFSGRLTAGSDGVVRFKVPTKGFHGELRFMAMAAKGRDFGSAVAKVKVDDPVIVEESLPRFLAPGDDFELPVTLFNRSGKPLAVTIRVRLKGPVAMDGPAEQRVSLGVGGQELVSFHLKALDAAGKAVVRVEADSPLGSFDDSTELAVRPGSPLRTVTSSGRLDPGDRTDLEVPGGFIRQGLKARLTLSGSRLLLYLRSLDYLVSYPYGCGEQLTSEAFPLLYFKDMGLLTGRYSDRAGAVEHDVQGAIDKLAQLQTSDGGFTYWPGGQDSDEWLSDYVTDFLLEARRLHYAVPTKTMDAALKRLGALRVGPPKGPRGRLDRREDNTDDSDVDAVNRPYALYIKALAGVPDRQSMQAFVDADRKTQDITDRCLVSLAYSAMGDRGTARRLLPDASFAWKLVRLLGGSLDSPNRETAMVLLALTQCDPQDTRVQSMVETLGSRMTDGHFGSTQDDSWAFRALGEALSEPNQPPVKASWGLKGGAMNPLSGHSAVLADPALSGRVVTLRNDAPTPLYYYLMAEGTPLREDPDRQAKGMRISRTYLDEQGKPLNLENVGQGQLVVIRLEVDLDHPVDNLAIVDLLPAGLEVENPRLNSRGGVDFDPGESFSPEDADFRDDRVLLFTGAAEGVLRFSYACRAVTPGRFKVPGLLVEAMYDPELYSRVSTDQDLIVARRRP